jgi:hypothetical protein
VLQAIRERDSGLKLGIDSAGKACKPQGGRTTTVRTDARIVSGVGVREPVVARRIVASHPFGRVEIADKGRILKRAKPVMRATKLTPPRPRARASMAANRRRLCSFRTGAICRYRLRRARACAARIMPRRYVDRFPAVIPSIPFFAGCGSIDSVDYGQALRLGNEPRSART